MQELNMAEGEILLWIQNHLRTSWLNPWMKTITSLADAGILWIVLVTALLLVSVWEIRRYSLTGNETEVQMHHWWERNFQTGIMGAAALALMLLVNNLILKNLIARIRPYDVIPELIRLIEKPGDFSFPSGHTAASFTVAWIFWRRLPRKIGIPSMIVAFLIGFSRMYVGVHYPTDVLGGAILGILYAQIAICGIDRLLKE